MMIFFQRLENNFKQGCRIERGNKHSPLTELNAKEIVHLTDYVNATSIIYVADDQGLERNTKQR
jgi:hypothetical protein